jgi:hypothetical protein
MRIVCQIFPVTEDIGDFSVIFNHNQIFPGISATNKRLRRKCKVCSSHKLRKETIYMSKECKVPLHLHIGNWFSSYNLKKSVLVVSSFYIHSFINYFK